MSYSGKIGDLVNGAVNIDRQCSNNSNTGIYPRDTTFSLNIGTYVLTKKITVNQQAALAYIAEVFKDTCKAEWDTLMAHQLALVDTMQCYRNCAQCGNPALKTATCDSPYCEPSPNRCDVIRSMMLADMSPGGQYAQFDRDQYGAIDASAYPLSIFNTANVLPLPQIPWSTLPASLAGNVRNLIDNWQPQYAESLLVNHPEKCMLGWCTSDHVKDALDFDEQILSTQYFADAVSKGYVTVGSVLPNSNIKPYDQLLNSDPWLSVPANAGIKLALHNKLASYGCSPPGVPVDQLAMQLAYCAYTNPAPDPNGATPVIGVGTPCTLLANYFGIHAFGTGPESDLDWTFLRDLYISAKNEALQTSMNLYANTYLCNSRCIGAKDYYDWSHFSIGASSFVNNPPCNIAADPFVWMLYKDKRGRFNSSMDDILNVMATAGINVDVTGITDFDDPCQFAAAIAAQTGSINQQVATTQCGGAPVTDSPCAVVAALPGLLDSIINHFPSVATLMTTNPLPSPFTLPLPSSVSSTSLSSLRGQKVNDSTLMISFLPCAEIIMIPYLRTSTGYQSPTSMCCISNISCPLNPFCSFDIKILYSNNTFATKHITTTCNFLSGCSNSTAQPPCSQPTPFVRGIKDYLTSIFNFQTANSHYPSPAQMMNMTPGMLRANDKWQLQRDSVVVNSNFTIGLVYKDTSGHEKDCSITVQPPSGAFVWSNVKSIISITPDMTAAVGGFTKAFNLQVLYGAANNSLAVINLKGSTTCFAINQCPPTKTLCDSLPVLPPYPYTNNCVNNLLATARSNAAMLYGQWEDSMKNDLLRRYYAKCLGAMETLTEKYKDLQYHYTLYYFDQAGNLAKTEPPAGVVLFNHADAMTVAANRAANYLPVKTPPHIKPTVYRYNTLNQAIWQETPDAGESDFFYDGLGRVVASQNARQKPKFFSYTRYDVLGRPEEAGKIKTNAINAIMARNFLGWNNFINSHPQRSEITLTTYDDSYTATIAQKFGTPQQQNLRKRVASVLYFETRAKLVTKDYLHATHYSYDIEGNVYKLIQDYPNGIIGDKTLEYAYDLQSCKVNQVTYQRGAMDQFVHRYNYDAANRLTEVQTSANGLTWETDAQYLYYRHGPKARMILGTDKVQGLDYMYTLQGWIAGVNGTTATPDSDMGQDGILNPAGAQTMPEFVFFNGTFYAIYSSLQLFGSGFYGPGYGTMNNPVAKDAFGYTLEYYPTDYKPIAGNNCLAGMGMTAGTVRPLYNGNISRMYTQIQSLGNNGYNYTYDQLNRITSQHAWNMGSGMAMLASDAWGGKLNYDPDGNITYQQRNGTTTNPNMDKLAYIYHTKNSGTYYNPAYSIPANATNKLAYVIDGVLPTSAYPNDLETQPIGNYQYDKIGNLISDASANVTAIDWNLRNKITKITKSTGANLAFEYDALGNRVMKDVANGTAQQNGRTFYVRDATGNTLATYTYKIPSGGAAPELRWSEAHLYGSSRIGIYRSDTLLLSLGSAGGTWTSTGGTATIGTIGLGGSWVTPITIAAGYYTANRGYKQYELANHLGNVLATITDRKLPVTSGSGGSLTYIADLLSAQDYYAFGMEMPGRNASSGAYRYGFGGQEKDNEVSGDGNSYTAEYWEYDPRLGKRWNIDPILKPWESPYASFANSPVCNSDLLGLDKEKAAEATQKNDDTKAGKEKQGDTYTDLNGSSFTYDQQLGWQLDTKAEQPPTGNGSSIGSGSCHGVDNSYIPQGESSSFNIPSLFSFIIHSDNSAGPGGGENNGIQLHYDPRALFQMHIYMKDVKELQELFGTLNKYDLNKSTKGFDTYKGKPTAKDILEKDLEKKKEEQKEKLKEYEVDKIKEFLRNCNEKNQNEPILKQTGSNYNEEKAELVTWTVHTFVPYQVRGRKEDKGKEPCDMKEGTYEIITK